MLKIDTHAHYLPRDWPDLAAKYGDNRFPVIHHGDDGRHRIYKDGKFFREIWPKTWDPDVRIADYARFGVQVQVISTVPVMFSYWAKPQHAFELHQSLNDHTAAICRKCYVHPEVVNAYLEKLLRACDGCRVEYVRMPTDRPVSAALGEYLVRRLQMGKR